MRRAHRSPSKHPRGADTDIHGDAGAMQERPGEINIPRIGLCQPHIRLAHAVWRSDSRGGDQAAAAAAPWRHFWVRQVSKMPGSQKGEQNRATDEGDGNQIDQIVRGHRQCREATGEQAVRLCLLAL